jgi:N-acetylneuraminate synthase
MIEKNLLIDGVLLGEGARTFFIADIGANHDGSLDRAKNLIWLAKESGANAAKFQHFTANKIVSNYGFSNFHDVESHQSTWKKSVVATYEEVSIPHEWTAELKKTCDEAGITFLSTPYDFDSVDHIDEHVSAYKLGSGDIDWLELVKYISQKNKPLIISTGASNFEEIERLVNLLNGSVNSFAVLQCNTNYTAQLENYSHINLRVIELFKETWPGLIVGLSDHSRGLAAVLGAVSLGAKIIERHFTDDINRDGPDHKFATTPSEWLTMVEEVRRLELALGKKQKEICENERVSAIVQRRCIRANVDLEVGAKIRRSDLCVLRPATEGSIRPNEIDLVVGRTLKVDLAAGMQLSWSDIE